MGAQELDPDGIRRIIPALPEADPVMGEIRWDAWERALRLTICLSNGTQASTDCETCAYEELRTARGKTFYTPEPSYVRVASSTQTRDGRSKWQKQRHKAYWAYTHWAQRCPACGEMFAWRRIGPHGGPSGEQIFYHPYEVAKKSPPTEGMLF
ncbi:hypothetical protein ACFPC0_11155 [Streptomyces andamanensis]|uniref:Uncharacterized protein n=1 Tax=Streptomyces andamanensis TaxID=1565035 RepID=A0ABV8TCU0_9ACTN